MLMAMLPRFVLLPDAALCFTCADDCVLVAPAGTTLQQHQQPRRHSSSSSSGGSGLRRHVAELEAKVCEQLQGSVKCHTDPFPAEFPCFLQLLVIEPHRQQWLCSANSHAFGWLPTCRSVGTCSSSVRNCGTCSSSMCNCSHRFATAAFASSPTMSELMHSAAWQQHTGVMAQELLVQMISHHCLHAYLPAGPGAAPRPQGSRCTACQGGVSTGRRAHPAAGLHRP